MKIRDKFGNKITRPKCWECESTFVYYRKRTDDFQCRSCGSTFSMKEKSQKKGKESRLGLR